MHMRVETRGQLLWSSSGMLCFESWFLIGLEFISLAILAVQRTQESVSFYPVLGNTKVCLRTGEMAWRLEENFALIAGTYQAAHNCL